MQENTKQVIVKMTARRCFRTEPIYQYDVGHELVFDGFDLPGAFEVHFSLSPMGKSITQIGTDGVCTVPDMYAQTAAPIYAWLYIADTDTGLTKYSIEIPVQRRAKPTDQQPTPVEQSAIDQAIAALNAGVEAAEDAQEAAEAAQASAESYAESAGQSAITATNAATSAAASAGNAASSATAAASSATDANASREAADQSATNAGVSERAAASSASAAAGSAASAAASASQASGSATAASGSASTASTKASEAAQSATAAAGSAASASEDAGTASTAATAAEASATAAAGSATAAAGSATSAGQSATAAAGSAQTAQDVLDSIPADYSELSGDVNSLMSAISGNQTSVELLSENGYYIATNTGTLDLNNPRSYYVNYRGKYALVPCVAGDVFFVTGKGANNHKPWATCNSSGTYIRSNAQNIVENEKVTIADGEAYLVYNGEDGSPALLLKGLNAIEEIELDLNGMVRFDEGQSLTDAQKAQARNNIGATDGSTIEDISDAIHMPVTIDLDSENGYYIATNTGTLDLDNPRSYYVNYRGKYKLLPVLPGDVFRVTGKGANNHKPWATCDSTGRYIRSNAPNLVTDAEVVIAQDEAYLVYNGEDGSPASLMKGTSAFEDLQKQIDKINKNTANPYLGMSCVAFGTSLTYRDLGYRPYLATDLGITIDNQGVGSAFWLTWQQDNSNILYNVQNYAGFADKDLCIIEGCTNDFGGNRTLGTYKDTGTNTVCGCLYNMISHVYTEKPGIQIFVILDHFGRIYGSSDSSPAKVNTDDKTQYDYYEECAKLCAFYGIPCIKTYEFCNVGPFGTEYLYDNIHLNALGGQQVAQAIAKAMLCYKPKILS